MKRAASEVERSEEELTSEQQACKHLQGIEYFLERFDHDVKEAMRLLGDRTLMKADVRKLRRLAGDKSIAVTEAMTQMCFAFRNAVEMMEEFHAESAKLQTILKKP